MRLEDRFELPAPPARVWEVLNDMELIAPYVPGFELKQAQDDVFAGTMKVKLGAMTVQYEAEITIAARDEESMTVRMLVSGRERRGTGRMKATVTSRLEAAGAGTTVALDTDLELAGKVAQMGRGMIADVSSKLVGDFVAALVANVLSAPAGSGGAPATGPPGEPTRDSGSARAPGTDAVVDLTAVASRSAAKRLGPPLLLVLALLLLVRRRRR